jgi:hypothetical protein
MMQVCDSGSEIVFMKISYIESVHGMMYVSKCYPCTYTTLHYSCVFYWYESNIHEN